MVSVLKKILSGESETRRQVLIVSAIIVALGIGVVISGVAANWGWSRLPGALLITAGGTAGGAAIGLARPNRERLWAKLAGWRVRFAIVVTTVIVAPAIVAMASATIGPLAGGGDAKDTGLVVLGAIIGFIMMVGTFLAGVVAVQATYRRVTSVVDRNGDAEDPS